MVPATKVSVIKQLEQVPIQQFQVLPLQNQALPQDLVTHVQQPSQSEVPAMLQKSVMPTNGQGLTESPLPQFSVLQVTSRKLSGDQIPLQAGFSVNPPSPSLDPILQVDNTGAPANKQGGSRSSSASPIPLAVKKETTLELPQLSGKRVKEKVENYMRMTQQDWEGDAVDPLEKSMASKNWDTRNQVKNRSRGQHNSRRQQDARCEPHLRGQPSNTFGQHDRENQTYDKYHPRGQQHSWRQQDARGQPHLRGQPSNAFRQHDREKQRDDQYHSRGHHKFRGQHRGGRYNRQTSPHSLPFIPYDIENGGSSGRSSPGSIGQSSGKSTPVKFGHNCKMRGRENGRMVNQGYHFQSNATNQSDFSGNTSIPMPQQGHSKITPIILAKCLVDFPDFSSSLLNLFDKFNFYHREIVRIVNENGHCFQLNGEIVTLKPKVEICQNHAGNDGCQSPLSCQNLHICPKYIMNTCYEGRACLLGHTWKTNHNSPILEANFISSIYHTKLAQLISTACASSQTEQLKICKDYNDEICKKDACNELHLCLAFVGKVCDSNEKCKLNHIMDKNIYRILELHGISVNESPRDLLFNISTCPLVKADIDSRISSKITSQTDEQKPNADDSVSIENASTPNNSNDENKDFASNIQQQPVSVPENKPIKTAWSHYLKGEVTLAEICYNSVEQYCPFEEAGCWRLHCSQHFHWQIKENGKYWLNLRPDQVLALEKAFCDPKETAVKIPPLDPSTLEQKLKGLLLVMQGRKQWEANFETMKLTLEGYDKDLELRRLCTEDTVNLPDPCKFIWYFCDINKNWIEYGNVDSTADEDLKTNIFSDDIEKHRRSRPNSPLIFQSSKFAYMLDTINMFQTNLDTHAKRNLRRRPRPHIKENEENVADATKRDVPPFWELMQPEERVRRVSLAHSSPEYIKVSDYFTKQGGTYNLIKIERVQNPYLWRAFQNKVEEMTSVYKTSDAVNIQQLFHGTSPDIVPKICEENFDWRLHGSNVGQVYGRGTYFSPLPSTSHGYTRPDASGYRYMFIAQVAVGSLTQGNSAMARPPINPLTNLPFDSTGNSIQNASIIVKYDKQEYFPEYILTLG